MLDKLKNIVGPKGWTTDPAELEPHLTEWRGAVRGATPIMVSPASTDEVSAIVRTCAEAGVPVVPQGGNTGMCGGAVPDASGTQVLLNLSRMNRIRRIDAADFSMIAEAGCILAHIQQAALDAGCFFPLSLGAEGSCQIGGNLATNAGGINVVRYGTARSQLLGLEVVLADGTVWDGLRTLRKDTAGYDLKQLFVGSEGTLGIITAAALRLYPHPGDTSTLFLGLPDAGRAIELLSLLQAALPDRVQAFELISGFVLGLVVRHFPDTRLPFDRGHPWYVMIEVAAGRDSENLENTLADALERGLAAEVVIAKNDAEADRLWAIRHAIPEAEKKTGKAQKHDISVPIARMPEFLERAAQQLATEMPDAQIVAFGHVGDGNLHYNVMLPPDRRNGPEATRATEIVYELVTATGGSICAEHGVGVLKKDYLASFKNDVELDLMRKLKRALDPAGLLNPGKIL